MTQHDAELCVLAFDCFLNTLAAEQSA